MQLHAGKNKGMTINFLPSMLAAFIFVCLLLQNGWSTLAAFTTGNVKTTTLSRNFALYVCIFFYYVAKMFRVVWNKKRWTLHRSCLGYSLGSTMSLSHCSCVTLIYLYTIWYAIERSILFSQHTSLNCDISVFKPKIISIAIIYIKFSIFLYLTNIY